MVVAKQREHTKNNPQKVACYANRPYKRFNMLVFASFAAMIIMTMMTTTTKTTRCESQTQYANDCSCVVLECTLCRLWQLCASTECNDARTQCNTNEHEWVANVSHRHASKNDGDFNRVMQIAELWAALWPNAARAATHLTPDR